MEGLKFVECQNCGTIHYVINDNEAVALEESGALFDEFSIRNLKCCSNCGLQNKFLDVSEDYTSEYSDNNKIPPILLQDDEFKETATKGTEN